jgi:hypothetical protein
LLSLVLPPHLPPPLPKLAEPIFGCYLNCLSPFALNFSLCFTYQHTVDRVVGFFSSRPTWDSPSPSPPGEYAPPFGSRGEGNTLACGRGGRGRPQFGREDRHCDTLGIHVMNVLCAYQYSSSASRPDPSFHIDADPQPTFHFDADPDSNPAPHKCDANLRPLIYRVQTTRLHTTRLF